MTAWEVEQLKLRIAERLFRHHQSEATAKHLSECRAVVARWEAWLQTSEPAEQGRQGQLEL